MDNDRIMINRAPVMTLWATVVAERLGYDRETALTLGRSVTGLNAQSKGQRLGIFEPAEEKEREARPERERAPGEMNFVELLGRSIPVVSTRDGLRAISRDKPVDPRSVLRYLNQKFGQNLDEVQSAMQKLAGSIEPDDLSRRAYSLYEKFRPEVPEGKRGWGAAGELDLAKIRALAK